MGVLWNSVIQVNISVIWNTITLVVNVLSHIVIYSLGLWKICGDNVIRENVQALH